MKKLILTALFFGIMIPAQKVWTLQDYLDYAVQNNITVKKASLNTQTAEVNLAQQKYNKLPSVSGSVSGGVTNGSSIDPITSDFVNKTILSNSYGVSGNVVLYQSNKMNLQIEKNKMLVSQSQLYQKQAENNIELNVLEAYLQALYYYEGIKIAEYTASSSAQELKMAQTKYKNGMHRTSTASSATRISTTSRC